MWILPPLFNPRMTCCGLCYQQNYRWSCQLSTSSRRRLSIDRMAKELSRTCDIVLCKNVLVSFNFNFEKPVGPKRPLLSYATGLRECCKRNHSACCWSNIAPSTAICIVMRSCGASNTSFVAWRPSFCGCWTTCMEQSTWVRHWLLVTSHL